MQLPVTLPNLGPNGKRAVRYAGWGLLGLFSFLIALQATFPYQRVVDKAVEALSPRYDIIVGSVDRGWMPGKMILQSVTVKSRPTKPDEQVSTMFFDRLEIDVNVLASVLGMRLDTDLDLYVRGGHIGGSIAAGKDALEISLSGEGVPADGVPGLTDAVGLPMTGKVDPLVELDLPKNDWRQAKGRIRLVCPSGCTVGDGVSKLKFKLKAGTRQAAFASEGVTIDKVFIDRFALQIDVAKGKLSIGTWELKSGDLEAKIELQVALAKSIGDSTVSTGCLRYKPSDTLSTRAPKTHAALLSTGAPLGPDTYYHITLQGRVAEMKRLPRVCGDAAADGDKDVDGKSRRPSLGKAIDDVATPPPPVPSPMPSNEVVPPPSPPPVPEDPTHGQGAGSGSAAAHDGSFVPSTMPLPGSGMGSGSAAIPGNTGMPNNTGGMVETPTGIVPAPVPQVDPGAGMGSGSGAPPIGGDIPPQPSPSGVDQSNETR